MRKLLCSSVIGSVLGLTVAMGSTHAAEENEALLGRLGNISLNAAEVRRMLSLLGPDARGQLADSQAELEKLIRTELVRRAVLQEAKEKGFDRKADVQFLMERGREQALVSAYVQSLVRPPADYPSEADVKNAYEANKQNLIMPAQYRLSRIFLSSSASGDKAKNDAIGKKATELATRLHASPDGFAQAAKEHSDHKASAANGGDMGWLPENRMAADLRAEVAKVDKGGVTSLIRARDGWNIIRVVDKKPSRTRTFDESRALITATLRQRRLQEGEKAYLEGFVQRSNMQMDPGEIARLQEGLQK